MKTFTIVKLYNNTIPLRGSIVRIGIENDGLEIVCNEKEWILTAEALAKPLRSISVKGPREGTTEKLYYYTLPKPPDKQQKLL
jgi:hypothetical protein